MAAVRGSGGESCSGCTRGRASAAKTRTRQAPGGSLRTWGCPVPRQARVRPVSDRLLNPDGRARCSVRAEHAVSRNSRMSRTYVPARHLVPWVAPLGQADACLPACLLSCGRGGLAAVCYGSRNPPFAPPTTRTLICAQCLTSVLLVPLLMPRHAPLFCRHWEN